MRYKVFVRWLEHVSMYDECHHTNIVISIEYIHNCAQVWLNDVQQDVYVTQIARTSLSNKNKTSSFFLPVCSIGHILNRNIREAKADDGAIIASQMRDNRSKNDDYMKRVFVQFNSFEKMNK